MDTWVKNKLKEWNLEKWESSFEEEDINEESFRCLDESTIDKLIPKAGPRLLFLKRFKSEFNSHTEEQDLQSVILNIPDPSISHSPTSLVHDLNFAHPWTSAESLDPNCIRTNPDFVSVSDSKSELDTQKIVFSLETVDSGFTMCEPITNLIDTLQTSVKGLAVLNYYKNYQNLIDSYRVHLADVIVDIEMRTSHALMITPERLIELAALIKQTFPTEIESTYYVPYRREGKTKISPKGKLHMRYAHFRDLLLESRATKNCRGVKRKNVDGSAPVCLGSYHEIFRKDAGTENLEDKLEWLKNTIDPWSTVEKFWKETSSKRIQDLITDTQISSVQYISSFPALRHTKEGLKLLEIDFALQYPEKIFSLYDNYIILEKEILSYCDKKKKFNNKDVKIHFNLLKEYQNESEDVRSAITFRLLPLLLPNPSLITSRNKSTWRPTREQVQNGFLLHVQNENGMNIELVKRRNQLCQFGLSEQPLPVIVGETLSTITKRFVIINDITYEVDTNLQCIDHAFKSFFAIKSNSEKHSFYAGNESSQLHIPVRSDKHLSIPFYHPNTVEIKTANVRASSQAKLLSLSLQLYGSNNLPWNQVQNIFEMMQNIISSEFSVIERTLGDGYRDRPNELNVVDNVSKLFKTVDNVFNGFRTEHNRFKALQESGMYIAPVEFFVGQRYQAIKRTWNDGIKPYAKNATAFLYPLRSIFKKVFEIPDVYNSVFAYKKQLESEQLIISNFVQSELWKKKIKNFPSAQVLPLFLFGNDFEAGNGLGSHAGVNKLGAVYVTIPCFPPHYRSSLNSIYHALLHYSKDREEFGNFAIFRTLLQELEFLETEGIELNLPEGKTRIYFKLGLILGDNLGLHSLLGFIENFNAHYSCRFCKMDNIQRSLATCEHKSLLRDEQSYQTDVNLNDSSLTGIKQKCIFNRLPGFHVMDNFAVDMMHDLMEGVFHSDMIELINYYTNVAKLFSLAEINDRIKLHDFGMIDSRNIPPQILPKQLHANKLKMSAGEMLTFVRHFGIIIGDLVPDDDNVWPIYLNLRQILDIVCSTSIQKECSELLNSLVSEHHMLVRTVFNRKLKAKDHNLTHYGTVMALSGPIINFWSMRFEAKHKESKLTATMSNSKINLCQTIATKNQLKLAHLLYSYTMFPLTIKTGKLCTSYIRNLSVVFDDSLKKYRFSYDTKIDVCNWIEKNGSNYKPGMVLCIGEHEQRPCFGIIKHMFMIQSEAFFVCQKVIAVFCNHMYAFKVINILSEHCIINYENLWDSYPGILIEKDPHYFILLRFTC